MPASIVLFPAKLNFVYSYHMLKLRVRIPYTVAIKQSNRVNAGIFVGTTYQSLRKTSSLSVRTYAESSQTGLVKLTAPTFMINLSVFGQIDTHPHSTTPVRGGNNFAAGLLGQHT